jgi:hypothetical protein
MHLLLLWVVEAAGSTTLVTSLGLTVVSTKLSDTLLDKIHNSTIYIVIKVSHTLLAKQIDQFDDKHRPLMANCRINVYLRLHQL